jgi:hypothetical protein
LYLDGIRNEDYAIQIGCYSWGGIRFLREPNVDPPLLLDTGSAGTVHPSAATYLVFPPEPGYYTNQDKSIKNYNIHGANVTIWPTRNAITESAFNVPAYSNPYSLNVSGSINASDKYYCRGFGGIDGTFRQYDLIQAKNVTCIYRGGILVSAL